MTEIDPVLGTFLSHSRMLKQGGKINGNRFCYTWPIFIRKKGRKKLFPENDACSRVLCEEMGATLASWPLAMLLPGWGQNSRDTLGTGRSKYDYVSVF